MNNLLTSIMQAVRNKRGLGLQPHLWFSSACISEVQSNLNVYIHSKIPCDFYNNPYLNSTTYLLYRLG